VKNNVANKHLQEWQNRKLIYHFTTTVTNEKKQIVILLSVLFIDLDFKYICSPNRNVLEQTN